MSYWKFRILETGEIAYVMGNSYDDAFDRLLKYFDPDDFSIFHMVSEDTVFNEGADVY